MHGSDSCASMACMHGCIQVAVRRHEGAKCFLGCRKVFSRFWANKPLLLLCFFPFFRSEIGLRRPRRRFTEIKDVAVLLSQPTTTLSDIAVCPSSPRFFFQFLFFSFGRRVCWLLAYTRALSRLAPRSLPRTATAHYWVTCAALISATTGCYDYDNFISTTSTTAQRATIRIEHSCRFLLQSKCPRCSRLDCGGMLEYMVVRVILG
jgi:hypothetical protein